VPSDQIRRPEKQDDAKNFEDRLGLCPGRLAADSAYGSAEMLEWVVKEGAIEPHIPVFDRSDLDEGTFSREDFTYNQEADIYVCPAGEVLTFTGTVVNDGATLLYRASKHDCDACERKCAESRSSSYPCVKRATPGRQYDQYQSGHHTDGKRAAAAGAGKDQLVERVGRKSGQDWQNGVGRAHLA
jgi:hypothetical protein